METSESISNIAKALAKAQMSIGGAGKNVENKFLKSKYADLQAVWEAIRIPFAENDLSVVQLPKTKESEIELETVLMHSSGEKIVDVFSMPLISKKPQDFGILIAYMRRYALSAMAGVYQEDEDGGNPDKKEKSKKYENESSATSSLMNSNDIKLLENICVKYKADYKKGLTGWSKEEWKRLCAQMQTNFERLKPSSDSQGDHKAGW